MTPLLQSEIPGLPCRRGKVRDVYDLGDRLVIVATDRISAFDWVLPTGIPDKGRILTQIDAVLARLSESAESPDQHRCRRDGPALRAARQDALQGRSMLVRKAAVVPFECVVRGYLAGSGWKEYRKHSTVCGIPLPAGLAANASSCPTPIFTPATKAESGPRREHLVRADGRRHRREAGRRS